MRLSRFIEDAAFLQSFLNENIWTRRYYRDFFPLEYNPRLSWDYLIGDKSAQVVADIVGFGSSAPEKSRETLSKIYGDLSALRVKRIMNEDRINDYLDLLGRPQVPEQKLLDFIFDDVAFVYEAVEAKREYLCLQALNKFELTITTPDPIAQSTVSFNLASAHKREVMSATSTRAWSTGSVSQYYPITDFWDIMDAAQDAGLMPPRYALMNKTQWRQFAKADETVDVAKAMTFNQPPRITPQMVNQALADYGLPQVIVIDSYIRTETREGVKTSTNCWSDNYVTFLPDLSVGKLLYGPIAAEGREGDAVTQSSRDGILISKWSDVDPVSEITKAESNCFPVIPNIANCWRLNVASYGSDGLE